MVAGMRQQRCGGVLVCEWRVELGKYRVRNEHASVMINEQVFVSVSSCEIIKEKRREHRPAAWPDMFAAH